ncbi:MAG: hypothetical protein RRY05_08755 [Bacteroidales bacterium]
MKKLILLCSLLVFLACSKDSSNETNDLEYIQIRVNSDDINIPNGDVYLFKVSGYTITNDTPIDMDNIPVSLSYISNGENSYMLSVSDKSSLYKSENYSVTSINWEGLSSLYGTPKAGDEYLIYISLNNGTYARATKRFIITKNSIINVRLTTCKDYSKIVPATWTITDYK